MRVYAAALFVISLRTSFAYVPEDLLEKGKPAATAALKEQEDGAGRDKLVRGRRADEIDEDFQVEDLCDKTEPIINCTDDEVHPADENCEYEQRGPSPDWQDTCGVKAVDCNVTFPNGTVMEGAESPWYPHCPGYQNITYYKGNNTYSCAVTDEAHTMDTCERTITVEDVTPPEITCPDDESHVETDPGVCTVMVNFEAMVSDNCAAPGDIEVTVDGNEDLCPGTHTITYTADDGCAPTTSCNQTVTVVDKEDPEITCPTDPECIYVDESCEAVYDPTGTDITASDNCDEKHDVTIEPTDDITFTCGQYMVEFTATDSAGNNATCDVTVNVKDDIPPDITCPADTTVCADDNCYASWTAGGATAEDNCDLPDYPFDDSGDVHFSGCAEIDTTKPITYTVTDKDGNTDYCEQDITFEDKQDPTVTCDGHVILPNECDQCYANYEDTVTFDDNCGVEDTTTDHRTRFNVTGKEGDPVTLEHSATDCAGNTAMCTTEVTVLDTQAPTIKCHVGEYGPDTCLITAEDNCAVKKVVCRDEWFNHFVWTSEETCLSSETSFLFKQRRRSLQEGGSALEEPVDWTFINEEELEPVEDDSIMRKPLNGKVKCTVTDTSHLTAMCWTKWKFVEPEVEPGWQDQCPTSVGPFSPLGTGEGIETLSISSIDDATQAVAWPFNVSWFGKTLGSGSESEFRVSTNGEININPFDSSANWGLVPIGSNGLFGPRIALMQEDLNPSSGGVIRVKSSPTSIVISFEEDVVFFASSDYVNAQVEIFPSGNMNFCFGDGNISGSNRIAIGIEDPARVENQTLFIFPSLFPLKGLESSDGITADWNFVQHKCFCFVMPEDQAEMVELEFDGDCCESNGSPACNDVDCTRNVCTIDPSCCTGLWHSGCAAVANAICNVCIPRGDCCVDNGTPGCDDPDCESTVCDEDSYCCDTEWDDICADEAADLCGDLCAAAGAVEGVPTRDRAPGEGGGQDGGEHEGELPKIVVTDKEGNVIVEDRDEKEGGEN